MEMDKLTLIKRLRKETGKKIRAIKLLLERYDYDYEKTKMHMDNEWGIGLVYAGSFKLIYGPHPQDFFGWEDSERVIYDLKKRY